MRVLAIGASGNAGSTVVAALVRSGIEVRALVHQASKEQAARDAGASDVAIGDLNDVDQVTAAADGVDGVFGVIPPFDPNETKIGQNMVAAASRAGARKFVFSSVYHPPLPLSNHQGKQCAEAALYESDLDFTILQPAVFMQQLGALWSTAQQSGVIAQAYSADALVAYVDYRDVAEVAALAFVDDRFAYGTFELSARGMYTRRDLARLMGEALGKRITAQAPGFDDWADRAGIPAGAMRDGLQRMTAHYDESGFHGGNSLVLETLLGREPTTVPDYIEELART